MANVGDRAKIHAALGEPVRLALVDQLVHGDLSPSELGRSAGLATNLLAHHLGVLEDAGVIRRVRSEGDGRRNYVQLVLDNPLVAALTQFSDPAPAAPDGVGRVVFVCTQNSARSQLAAAAWSRASDVPATSAGTHPAPRVHPRAISIGRRHGLRLPRTRTAHLDDVTQHGDFVVAVCDNAYEELPATARPQLHWSIPDPARPDTDAAFEAAYAQIDERVQRLAATLAPVQRSTS